MCRRVLIMSGIFVLALALGCVTRYKEPERGPVLGKEHWEKEIARITVGMPRLEVERILMPYPRSPFSAVHIRRGQVVTYWVDPEWRVSITYDYQGIHGEDGPTSFTRQRATNRVLLLPIELVHEVMPEMADVGTLQFGGQ